MKLLVFSDSHNKSRNIETALKNHNFHCDFVIFLGDGLRDIGYIKSKYPDLHFFCVSGNCDLGFSDDYREDLMLDLEGVKILITHGHKYGVKYSYDNLLSIAENRGANAVLFGHTHEAIESVEYINGKRIQLFNPGSIGFSGSYGVIEISNNVLITSVVRI